jgi:hypothetical protein
LSITFAQLAQRLFLAVLPLFLALPVQAGTCASQCGPAPLSFTPGSTIEVEVVNLSPSIVLFQEAGGSDPIPLPPGRTLRLPRLTTTIENASLTFWDSLGLAVKATLTKPQADVLRVQLLPDYDPPGEGTIYLRDDGRVEVF